MKSSNEQKYKLSISAVTTSYKTPAAIWFESDPFTLEQAAKVKNPKNKYDVFMTQPIHLSKYRRWYFEKDIGEWMREFTMEDGQALILYYWFRLKDKFWKFSKWNSKEKQRIHAGWSLTNVNGSDGFLNLLENVYQNIGNMLPKQLSELKKSNKPIKLVDITISSEYNPKPEKSRRNKGDYYRGFNDFENAQLSLMLGEQPLVKRPKDNESILPLKFNLQITISKVQ